MYGALALLSALAFQDAPKWDELRSEAGNFIIWLPVKADYEAKETEFNGATLKLHQFIATGETMRYAVIYTDYDMSVTSASDDDRINAERDSFMKGLDGKLDKEKKLTLSKNPGRACFVSTDSLKIETRIYLVKNRVYMTMALGEKEKYDESAARKALDSFKLIDEK